MGGEFDFKAWYDENGEELNKSRRDRYHSDPEYKARVLKGNRERRRKAREEKSQEQAKEREAKKVRIAEQPYRVVEATIKTKKGTVKETLFTIGALARVLGCSVQAVRLWERRGVLPETPLRNTKGDRLYTADQVEQIRELMIKQGRLQPQRSRRKYTPRDYTWEVKRADGKVVKMKLFRIGVLATAIDRTVMTVEQMESRGALPPTPFRATKTRYRLYSLPMIEAVKTALDKHGDDMRGDDWQAFFKDVHKRWKALGVIGAELVKRLEDKT